MTEPREECLRCDKPRSHCVCADVVRVAPTTRVRVLQHPRERAHPLGTARFIALGIEGARVDVAHGLDGTKLLAELGERPALLFPGPASRAIEELEPADRPTDLVVLDGTWPCARALLRANPQLAALPRLTLSTPRESRYRIRREPKRGYLSTLEAVLAALVGLEPELAGVDALLVAFDRMIDRQIASHEASAAPARRRRRGNREYVGVPRALGEEYARLVLVYADFGLRRPDRSRRLLRVTAVRLADGELFSRYVSDGAVEADLPPGVPELGASLRAVASSEVALADLARFAGPDAVLGAWNGEVADRFATQLALPSVDLAAAYRAYRGRGQGVIERVLANESIAPHALALEGRASTRLGNAVALARFLHARSVQRALGRAQPTATVDVSTG